MSLGRLHLVGWKGAWNTRQRGIAAWSRSIVDGRNPANQLRLVVYPIICRLLYISGGAGFLRSTVWWMWRWMNFLAVHFMSLLFQSPEETGHFPLARETLPFSVAGFLRPARRYSPIFPKCLLSHEAVWLVHHFVLSVKVSCHELLSSQQALDTGMCVRLGCSWRCANGDSRNKTTCMATHFVFRHERYSNFKFLSSCHVVVESILDQLSPKQMTLPKGGPLHKSLQKIWWKLWMSCAIHFDVDVMELFEGHTMLLRLSASAFCSRDIILIMLNHHVWNVDRFPGYRYKYPN